jgi:hypothetical protein
VIKRIPRTYRYPVQEPIDVVKERMAAYIKKPLHIWDDRDLCGDYLPEGNFVLKLVQVGFYKGPRLVDSIHGRIIADDSHTRIEVAFKASLALPIFCGFVCVFGLVGFFVKWIGTAPLPPARSFPYLFQAALALGGYYWLSKVFLQTSRARFERLLFTVLQLNAAKQ